MFRPKFSVLVHSLGPLPTLPFVGAVLKSHTQLTVPDSVPAEQLCDPDTVHPLLHDGVHVPPLARLVVQPPTTPFVGAATVQGFASQVAAVLSPVAEQLDAPDTVYPLLHAG